MRRARSQPLGANRFRTIQVLGDLKLYEDRIAAYHREASLLEAEWLARMREMEEAARALQARKAAIALQERRELEEAARALQAQKAAAALQKRKAVEAMTLVQQLACRWEERVVAWLSDGE